MAEREKRLEKGIASIEKQIGIHRAKIKGSSDNMTLLMAQSETETNRAKNAIDSVY